MQTPYDPPAASLEMGTPIELKKLNVWKMIFLTIITVGLYVPYWMYTRTKMLNLANEEESVSKFFTILAVSLLVLTYGFDVGSEFIKPEPGVAGIFKFIGIASNLCALFWALMFRSGLNSYTRAKKGDDLWSNGFFTWLFQAFYHQYKINKILEAQDLTNVAPSQGDGG